jgi:hypothetical protein
MTITTLLYLAIALASTACARLTRENRNYWPMLRVIWMALGFVYFGSFANAVFGGGERPAPATRVVFGLVMLGAVAYSAWFMARRNKTPRFVALSVNGQPEVIGMDELMRATDMAVSMLQHGAMPAHRIPEIEAALAKWHTLDQWKRAMKNRRWRKPRDG